MQREDGVSVAVGIAKLRIELVDGFEITIAELEQSLFTQVHTCADHHVGKDQICGGGSIWKLRVTFNKSDQAVSDPAVQALGEALVDLSREAVQ